MNTDVSSKPFFFPPRIYKHTGYFSLKAELPGFNAAPVRLPAWDAFFEALVGIFDPAAKLLLEFILLSTSVRITFFPEFPDEFIMRWFIRKVGENAALFPDK